MQIALHLDRQRLFRWHRGLIDALEAAGHEPIVVFSPGSETLPSRLSALLRIDRALAPHLPGRFSERLAHSELEAAPRCPANGIALGIDLTSKPDGARSDHRWLTPLFNGIAGDMALLLPLGDGSAPTLSIADSARAAPWAIGQPAIEDPLNFARSIDEYCSRIIEGLLKTIAMIANNNERHDGAPQHMAAASAKMSVLGAPGLTQLGWRRIKRKSTSIGRRLLGMTPNWKVAWRLCDTDLPPQPGDICLDDYRILPSDGHRFYADPIVFAANGQRVIFVEDYAYQSGYGIISCTTIASDGSAGPVEPVLDTGSHLSYPFVFARDGQIWMLPESAAADALHLYRCEAFPNRWTRVACLVPEAVHDATLFEHQGRLWLAASKVAYQSSSWDSLVLYSSDSLLGPWQPHGNNPVVLDRRSARPAGPVIPSVNGLIRPAQDCSRRYGGQIALNKVDVLTATDYAETVLGHIGFAPQSGLSGPHTLCRAFGIEAIDFHP
jgi:hypothetical protein